MIPTVCNLKFPKSVFDIALYNFGTCVTGYEKRTTERKNSSRNSVTKIHWEQHLVVDFCVVQVLDHIILKILCTVLHRGKPISECSEKLLWRS